MAMFVPPSGHNGDCCPVPNGNCCPIEFGARHLLLFAVAGTICHRSRKKRSLPPPDPLTKGGDESSENDTKDKEDEDDHESRYKKIKKVETSNPFSTFEKQTRNKNYYFFPTIFAKEHWLKIRVMYSSERFNRGWVEACRLEVGSKVWQTCQEVFWRSFRR